MSVRKNSDSRFMILYHENVDIDGFNCRREFSNLISRTGRKKIYQRAHEWCCGHGAIGFQILEDGLCRHLVLTDKFDLAVQDCEYTIAANDLQDRTTVYQTSSLSDLPREEKWDLFVANPPWRPEILPGPDLDEDLLRKMFDIGWQTHADMWENLGSRVCDDADVYIYEDLRFSTPEQWLPDIQQAGLDLCEVYERFGIISTGYVMRLKKIIDNI